MPVAASPFAEHRPSTVPAPAASTSTSAAAAVSPDCSPAPARRGICGAAIAEFVAPLTHLGRDCLSPGTPLLFCYGPPRPLLAQALGALAGDYAAAGEGGVGLLGAEGGADVAMAAPDPVDPLEALQWAAAQEGTRILTVGARRGREEEEGRSKAQAIGTRWRSVTSRQRACFAKQ